MSDGGKWGDHDKLVRGVSDFAQELRAAFIAGFREGQYFEFGDLPVTEDAAWEAYRATLASQGKDRNGESQ